LPLTRQIGLDRISTALEGNKIFMKLFSDDRIPVWIQSDNWKLRALSLTALTQISEGCKGLLAGALDQVGRIVCFYYFVFFDLTFIEI
jgi:hypothetical protein